MASAGRETPPLLRDDPGAHLDLMLLELGDQLRAAQLDRAHDRFVLEVAELRVADQLIDTELGVADHLLEALVGGADDDHFAFVEDLRIEVARGVLAEKREDLVLLFLREVRELPFERELREVLVPPPHRIPDAVLLALSKRVGAVHERVRGDAVVLYTRDRLRGLLRFSVVADVLGHLGDRLHDRERQQPETELPGDRAAALRGRGHPRRRVRVLDGLRRHHAAWEVEARRVILEVLALPHAADDLDRFLPIVARLLAIDAERDLLHRRGAPGAPLDAALRQDVDGRHFLRDSSGVDEPERHEYDAEAEADLVRRLAERAEHDFAARGVRAPFPEMMLHAPHRL